MLKLSYFISSRIKQVRMLFPHCQWHSSPKNAALAFGETQVDVDALQWYADVCRVMADCRREFCSKCGNKTLSRVTVSYNDDGTVQYYLSRHKTFSTRGLRVSSCSPEPGLHVIRRSLCIYCTLRSLLRRAVAISVSCFCVFFGFCVSSDY